MKDTTDTRRTNRGYRTLHSVGWLLRLRHAGRRRPYTVSYRIDHPSPKAWHSNMRSWRNGIDPDCIAKTKAKTQTTIRQILADTLNCSFYGRVWEQLAPLVS